MKKWVYSLCFILFWSLSSDAFAALEDGNVIVHDADQVFAENVTIAAQEFSSEAFYNRDVVLLSREALMNGYIEGDLLAATQDLEIRGEVEGDVRVVGGRVMLNGVIHGDVLIFGGEVEATSDAVILGDAIIMGGRFIHEGVIQGEARVISGNVMLGGVFADALTVTTQDLTVQEELSLSVGEESVYFSPHESVLPESFEGSLEYNKTSLWYKNTDFQSSASLFFGFWSLLKFVTSAVLIFLLYFIFKNFVEDIKKLGTEKWLKSGVIGIIAFLAIPTVAILLMVSLIGLPIGILLMLTFWSLLILRISLASFVLSQWIPYVWKKLFKKQYAETQYSPLLWAIIALALITIVNQIPYIGALAVNILTIISFGATLYVLYKNIFRR